MSEKPSTTAREYQGRGHEPGGKPKADRKEGYHMMKLICMTDIQLAQELGEATAAQDAERIAAALKEFDNRRLFREWGIAA